MSNKITITDFLIKLGFDSSEVKKGVKTLEKEFAPLNKKLTKDAVKQTKQQKVKNNELKIENRLTIKRLAIQKQIDTLKAKGDTKTARSLTGSLRGKNIDKLETARLRGVEAIRKVEAEISSSKIKAGKVADKELASRRKIKAEYQAYAEDVRRTDKAQAAKDSVKRKAALAEERKLAKEAAAQSLASRRKIKAEYQAYAEDIKRTNRAQAAIDKAKAVKETARERVERKAYAEDIKRTNRAQAAIDKAKAVKETARERVERKAYAEDFKRTNRAQEALTKANAAKKIAMERAERKAYEEDFKRTNRAQAATDKTNAANARANRQKKSREETITGRRITFDRTLTNASRSLGDVNPVDDKQAEAIRALRKEYALLAQKGKLAKTANDFKQLGKEYDTLKDRTRKVTKATKAMRADMKKSEFAAKSMKDSMRNLARSYLSIYAVGASVVSVVRTGQELMSLKATLLGVSGTAQGAAEDFSFISAASRRLGVDLTEATSAYGKLGAAAKAAGLDNSQARNAFLASAELATAFNLSTSDFEGVSRAMSQILSKGKLSTEE